MIRSAYGISYIHFNRLGGENLLSFNGPHVVGRSASRSRPSQGLCAANQAPTTCFRTTQQGYPEGLNAPANFNPLNARVNYIPRDTPTGNVQSWHVTVQRELAQQPAASTSAYVGNKSRDIMILGDYNQARPNDAGENTPLQARRPIQGFQDIQVAFAGGKGDYHALQVKVERRYTRGLYLLNSFTWSRARDNASGHLEVAERRQQPRQLPRPRRRSSGGPATTSRSTTRPASCGSCRSARTARWAQQLNPVMEGILGGWRLIGDQHDDQRRAGQPDLLAGRGVHR